MQSVWAIISWRGWHEQTAVLVMADSEGGCEVCRQVRQRGRFVESKPDRNRCPLLPRHSAGLALVMFPPASSIPEGFGFDSTRYEAMFVHIGVAGRGFGYGVAAFGTGPLRDLVGLPFSTIFTTDSIICVAAGGRRRPCHRRHPFMKT